MSRIETSANGADSAISPANASARGAQVVGGGEPIGEARCGVPPHPARRRRVYMSSSASLLPDDRRQRHRDAEALVEAEPGEVAAEAGLGRGDAEVGRQREPEPAAHGRTLHRGDDRLVVGEEACRLLVEARGAVEEVAAAQIGAGAEVLALRAEHHGPAVGLVVEAEHRVGEHA